MSTPLSDVPTANTITIVPLSPAEEAAAQQQMARLLGRDSGSTRANQGLGAASDAAAASLRAESYTFADRSLLLPLFGLQSSQSLRAKASTFLAAVGAVRMGALVYDDLEEVPPEDVKGLVTSAAAAVEQGGGGLVGSVVSASEASYLSNMIASSDCKYVPLVQGQVLALPAAATASNEGGSTPASAAASASVAYRYFRVAATNPRFTAVIVAPGTQLDYQG